MGGITRLPPKRPAYLADAMRESVKYGVQGYEASKDEQFRQSQEDRYKDQWDKNYRLELERTDYNKRKDLVDFITEQVKYLEEGDPRAEKILNDPQVIGLFESVGAPLPIVGSRREKTMSSEEFKESLRNWNPNGKKLNPETKTRNDEVKMRSPDGTVGFVPYNELEDAIKEGYKVVR